MRLRIVWCPLTQRPSGQWVCPVCDPAGKRPIRVQAKRTCRVLCPPELLADLKETRKAACEGCEWLDAGRCLAQIKASCPNQTAPRIDEIAGYAGAKCPEGRWEALVLPSKPSLAGNSVMRWAYGVTTVPSRRLDLLPETLASLRDAGFDKPRLFIDDAKDDIPWRRFGLDTTVHHPVVGAYGNWILGMWELYVHSPTADRYIMFQDDIVVYRNLRSYLEKLPFPQKAYLNLYTMPHNLRLCNGKGYHKADQKGKGGLALMFTRAGLQELLKAPHMILKPTLSNGRKSLDGAVVTGMIQRGFKEFVHNPSLVQHTGQHSSALRHGGQPLANSFRGKDFNAMDLLKGDDKDEGK